MQLIRLLVTLAALAAVYFAQYIFHYQSLQDFFPQRLLDLFPTFYRVSRWLPEDLWQIALWLSAAAIVAIGLVMPAWPDALNLPASYASTASMTTARRVRLNTLALLVAFFLATGLGLFLALGGLENLWLQVTWASSILLYLLGARADKRPAAAGTEEVLASQVQPRQSWRMLLPVLIAAGLVFNWPFRTVVPPLNDEVATMGLRALSLTQGAAIRLFENTETTYSGLALLPFALLLRLLGDGLQAARILGSITALLLILVTWLLGCELFRRTPMVGPYGELVEDDGRWPALVGSGLVATSVVIFHFSRLPFYLEPVVLGGLGLWVWLRSLRTGQRLGLALSGVLIGLSAALYQSGLLFLLMMPLWWLGVRLFQPNWLRAYTQMGEGLRTARRSFLWWGGLWVTLAPLIGIWARSPDLLLGRIQGAWLPDLSRVSAALNLPIDPAAGVGQLDTGQNLLVAPLFLLALGALLLNLDRLVGWLLVSWFGCALVVGGVMATPTLLWPTLVPLLPALALIVAFTLDRLRTTLVESAGAWTAQAMTYLSIGLVVWAGQASWIEYNRFVRTTITPEHYVGFGLRRFNPQSQSLGFIQVENQASIWQMPLVRFLVNDKFAGAAVTDYPRANLPATLPPHAVLVWQPVAGDDLLGELQARYPGGSVRSRRDNLANPVVYFYELP